MKPDYKNWIPKGMLFSLIAGTMLSLALLLVFGVFGIGVSGKLRIVLSVVFGIAFVVCAKYTVWCVYAYRSFSYDGERKLSKQLIDGTAEQITLPEGGVGLDIGCGSGILSIASLLLGAKSAFGVDIDSLAVKTAQANALENGFDESKFKAVQGNLSDKVSGKYNVVVANIVADIIMEFNKEVGKYLENDGVYITGGIIESREDEVLLSFAQNGFEVKERFEEKGWLVFVVKKSK